LRARKERKHAKVDIDMNRNFGVEYRLNHSGLLLLRRAHSIVKNTKAHQGRDKNNLNDLMLPIFVSIIF